MENDHLQPMGLRSVGRGTRDRVSFCKAAHLVKACLIDLGVVYEQQVDCGECDA